MESKQNFWTLLQPIIIVLLCLAGFFQDLVFDKDMSSILFIVILGLSLLFRFKLIIGGFATIIAILFKKNRMVGRGSAS